MQRIYLLPFAGYWFRRFVESFLGERDFQNADSWDKALQGWASSYLQGTVSIDVRSSITAQLAETIAPHATSLLDLGCAGATLAQRLGPRYDVYWGVDISSFAVSQGKANILTMTDRKPIDCHFEAASILDFQPARQFDVIVFNEVLYYLPLNQIAPTLNRYAKYLAQDGIILVSLKNEAVARLVQSVALRRLEFVFGVLWQEQIKRPSWNIMRNRERPAHLLHAFRKAEEAC
jgi:2-polyprenyl-3-methyl-5-hydroxy-6-metoxy-1,4-benzoquinol methylase